MTREPVTILEIDVPYCNLTFGAGACTAALSADVPAKCFNMYKGCPVKDVFDAGTITLRFATGLSGLLKSEQIYPAMSGEITGAAMEITVSPVDTRKSILGRRETLKVSMSDFKDNDTQLDKYQAERVSGAALFSGVGYEPEERGTFFGRLWARWPYWKNADCRVRRGYVGDALADFTTEHFVLYSADGPGALGGVTLELRDELSKVTDERYLPEPSIGQLAADIGTGLDPFDIEPAGEGANYDAAGRVCIGDEIMTYTRSGDTFTPTARGVDGSDVSEHSFEDTVQLCYRFDGVTIDEAVASILEDGAGIDAARIPSTQYADEVDTWLPSFRVTRTIAKPEKTEAALTSILSCFGVFIWWDRENRIIPMRVNRPVNVDETPSEIDGESDFIEGTFKRTVLHSQRYTDVLMFHGIKNMTGSATDVDNYDRAELAVDTDATGANTYGEPRIMTLHCPWLGNDGDRTTALIVAARLLIRFNDAPVQITGMVDREKIADLAMAGAVDMTLRTEQADDGSIPSRRYQLVRDQRLPNERNGITLESYDMTGNFGFITEDSQSDYDSATDEEIADGCFISEDAAPYSFTPYEIF